MVTKDQERIALTKIKDIEQPGTNENVSVLRDGKEYKYSEVASDEETDSGQPV